MSGVQSIERAFAILRVLALGRAGVTELADRTALPKSTVSRLLMALESERAVEQVATGGAYVIGEGLRTIGASASPAASMRAMVRPLLEELSSTTSGSAGFTILDGPTVYWVDNVDDVDAMVQITDQTGQSFPLHTVPSGLALLAQFSAEALDAYLAEPLEAIHANSITDPDRLRRRLDRIGADGVVVSHEELYPGINAVAAPFRGGSGEWEGAVYLQGPSFRFPKEGDEARVVKLVTEAAALISERFALL